MGYAIKPPLEEVQQDIYQSFFGSFDAMRKVFNLNRKLDDCDRLWVGHSRFWIIVLLF